MNIVSQTPQETQKIAGEIGGKIKNGGIICLFGDLGSGKTVFTQGIAEKLKIDKFSIKSPTYTYIREYNYKKAKLYHIDLYRLEEIDELLWQEIRELMENEKNILIIEWADKLGDKLPDKRIDVFMEYISEHKRKISTKPHD